MLDDRWIKRQEDGFRVSLLDGPEGKYYSFKGKKGWPFCPSTRYFINDLCESHRYWENQHYSGAEVTVTQPQRDCLLVLFITENLKEHNVTRYDAWRFNGRTWRPEPKPDFIQIGPWSISAWVDNIEFTNREPYYFPVKYLLDFWLGSVSISDLFAIKHEYFLRNQITRALDLKRKLKGAVRSETAREIASLLEVVAGVR